jgi:hypothetical protein
MVGLWKPRCEYFKRQESKYDHLIPTNGWALDTSRTSREDYKKEEVSGRSRWEKYQADCGQGSEMIMTDRFTNLVREGIPDVLRGTLYHSSSSTGIDSTGVLMKNSENDEN